MLIQRFSILASSLFLVGSISTNIQAKEQQSTDCDNVLLISSYDQNNVQVFNGCDGTFIKSLDDQGLIGGAQAIIELPNNKILVASEKNDRLVTFDVESLSGGEVVVSGDTSGFIDTPLALALDANNQLYVGSYSENKIVKIDPETWQVTDVTLPGNNGLIRGLDAGMVIENNMLYAPGYDSDNVIKVNLADRSANEWIANGSNGLDRARGITVIDQELFVTSEKTNEILVYDINSGVYKRTLSTSFLPAGVQADGENHLIYNNRTQVYRINIDGSDNTQITQSSYSELNGATFVYRLYTSKDADNDGLKDSEEQELGTDPNNPDSDGDTMPDGYEVEVGLNPLVDDASADPDSDSLSNVTEYTLGTDPLSADTDEDGIADGVDENPTVADSQPSLSGEATSSVLQGAVFSFIPTLEYPGKKSQLTFSIENKPNWAEFSSITGELNGTPENSDVGNYQQIFISVSNGMKDDELPAFDIEVVNVNDAPMQTSDIPNKVKSIVLGESFAIEMSSYIEDIDAGDSLLFSAEGFNEAIVINEQGSLTGSPTAVGDYTGTVTAVDTSGEAFSVELTLSVVEEKVATLTASDSSSGGGSVPLWLLLSFLVLGISRATK